MHIVKNGYINNTIRHPNFVYIIFLNRIFENTQENNNLLYLICKLCDPSVTSSAIGDQWCLVDDAFNIRPRTSDVKSDRS